MCLSNATCTTIHSGVPCRNDKKPFKERDAMFHKVTDVDYTGEVPLGLEAYYRAKEAFRRKRSIHRNY